MSQPQKLPIHFAKEESFSASINLVRKLSEGSISRDPYAPIIQRPIRPTRGPISIPIRNPRIRSLSHWQIQQFKEALRFGISVEKLKAQRAQRVRAIRHAKKEMALK